jgi:hypothetical protein
LPADLGLPAASQYPKEVSGLIVRYFITVRLIQQYQSQLQHNLVNLSLLNAFFIAKLNSISIKAKANSPMLIDMPPSKQSAMIHFDNDSSQSIVKYIYPLDSEGAHTAILCNTLCWLIVDNIHLGARMVSNTSCKEPHGLIVTSNAPLNFEQEFAVDDKASFDTSNVFNRKSKLIVDYVLIPSSEGAQSAASKLIFICIFGFNKIIEPITVFCHIELIQIIMAFHHNNLTMLNNINHSHQLIDAFDHQKIFVAYINKNSKISLIFQEKCRIFCEGEWEVMDDGNSIVKQQSAVGPNSIGGLIGLLSPNGFVGLRLINHTGLIILNGFVRRILVSHFGLIGLSLIDLNCLIGLISLIGHTGLIGLNDLVGHSDLVDHIGHVSHTISLGGIICIVGHTGLIMAFSLFSSGLSA